MRVACAPDSVVCRSAAIVGNAGRYMSMANGPTAVSSPSTIALLAKDVFIDESGTSPGLFAAGFGSLHGELLRRNKPPCMAGTTLVQPALVAHDAHHRAIRGRSP